MILGHSINALRHFIENKDGTRSRLIEEFRIEQNIPKEAPLSPEQKSLLAGKMADYVMQQAKINQGRERI